MHQAIDDLAQILPERYARTTVSQRIEDAVQYARSAGCAVVIRGPAGMGKSSALADICRRTPEAVAFEIVQVQKTRKGLFNSLADALAVYHDRTFTRDLYDVLTYRLEDAARQGNFVMVDEVQNAGTDGVRTLMELQERTGIPLILTGNPAAIKRTHANSAVFDQIEDRVTNWVELGRPDARDIELIGMEWGVEGAEAYRYLAAYGQRSKIRKAVQLLKLCRRMAGDRGWHRPAGAGGARGARCARARRLARRRRPPAAALRRPGASFAGA